LARDKLFMPDFPKKIFTAKIIFFAGLLLLGSHFLISFAQSPPAAEGVTISPPIVDIALNPGEESEQKILVTNPTENLLELYSSTMNFNASGESGEPGFYPASEEASKFSLAHWIVLSQPKIAVAPKQVVEFRYKIAVPPDAEPGGHYGVVFLGTEPPAASGEVSQVTIASQVGSLILARVPGDIREEATLEEFSAPWFFLKPPVPFTTFIRNQGNIHFKPRGEITIKNWRGKEMERVALNEKNGNVLPESRRKFEPIWDAPAKPFWKIPVGRFSADLRAVYGQNDQTLGSKIYFWIIPWWVIIAALILILLLIIIFIIWRRRRKKKKKGPPAAGSAAPPPLTENPRYFPPSNQAQQPRFPPRRTI